MKDEGERRVPGKGRVQLVNSPLHPLTQSVGVEPRPTSRKTTSYINLHKTGSPEECEES